MIFLTVGTQGPFDRLIRAVDQWAAANSRCDVFAQVGAGSYEPRYIRWVRFVDPLEFRAKIAHSSVVVAHAGMGSIITALELGKPILVMPRRGDLKEHRNDHQIDTARHFLAQGRISVAFDDQQLCAKLDELYRLAATAPLTSQGSPQLLQTLRQFLDRGVVSCGQTRSDGWVLLSEAPAGRAPLAGGQLPQLRVELEESVRPSYLHRFLVRHSGRMVRHGQPAMLGPLQISRTQGPCKRAAGRIRKAINRLGIRLPQLWTTTPAAARLVQHIPHAKLVYQPSQSMRHAWEFEEDLWLKAHADITLFTSFAAFEAESAACHRPQLLAELPQPKRLVNSEVPRSLPAVLTASRPAGDELGELSDLAMFG